MPAPLAASSTPCRRRPARLRPGGRGGARRHRHRLECRSPSTPSRRRNVSRQSAGPRPGDRPRRDVGCGQHGAEPLHARHALTMPIGPPRHRPTRRRSRQRVRSCCATSRRRRRPRSKRPIRRRSARAARRTARSAGIALGEQAAAAVDRRSRRPMRPTCRIPTARSRRPGSGFRRSRRSFAAIRAGQTVGHEERRPVPPRPAAGIDQRGLRARLQRNQGARRRQEHEAHAAADRRRAASGRQPNFGPGLERGRRASSSRREGARAWPRTRGCSRCLAWASPIPSSPTGTRSSTTTAGGRSPRSATAIMDGNDATERDAGWTPLNATPMHPEYPSQAAIVAGVVVWRARIGVRHRIPAMAHRRDRQCRSRAATAVRQHRGRWSKSRRAGAHLGRHPFPQLAGSRANRWGARSPSCVGRELASRPAR